MRQTKTTNSSTTSSPVKTMEELLKKAQITQAPQKGALVTGVITKLTPSEILIDINAKTEAVVLEKDKRIAKSIFSHLKPGDTVTVSILNPESDLGHPVVSMRRFLAALQWDELVVFQKERKSVKAVVTQVSRGGFLVETDTGVSGFLPQSQAATLTPSEDSVGQTVSVFVGELDKEQKKIIFSQKPILDESQFKEAALNLKKGKSVSVKVSGITPFGLFVSVPSALEGVSLDGLIHISEVSWEKTASLEGLFEIGQPLSALVTEIDPVEKRLALSLKRLSSDPFEEAAKSFTVDQNVEGRVAALTDNGVIIDLGNGIEGVIRKDKIPPTLTYALADRIHAVVSQIDLKKRKILLVPSLATKPIGYR